MNIKKTITFNDIPVQISKHNRKAVKSPRGVNCQNLLNVIQPKHFVKANTRIHADYLNARSVNNKTSDITNFVSDHKLDICIISEAWLSNNLDKIVCGLLTPGDFNLIHVNHDRKR